MWIEKDDAIYLYCFARRDCAESIHSPGLCDECSVLPLKLKEIVAVVSKTPVEPWAGQSAETNLRDLGWVGPRACRHEKVVEEVMRSSPVLPARFGTLFSSLERLESLVNRHYAVIIDFLNYIRDKEEWALKSFVDREKADEYLVSVEVFPLSDGARYLAQQRLRAESGEKMKNWIRTTAQAISAEFAGLAMESRSLKTLPREMSGRDKDMAFNWAFLLTRSAETIFRERVRCISAQYSKRGLSLEPSGPWPPYNFCPAIAQERVGKEG